MTKSTPVSNSSSSSGADDSINQLNAILQRAFQQNLKVAEIKTSNTVQQNAAHSATLSG
jgi:hypothetical protein